MDERVLGSLTLKRFESDRKNPPPLSQEDKLGGAT